MKSDVILVSNDGSGVREALEQAESVAAYKQLSQKEALHLRLLSEEMLGMLQAMLGTVEARFWIEDKRRFFELHLCADTLMSGEKRRQLLSVTTSGKNAAATGIMGRIREAFAAAMEAENDSSQYFVNDLMLGTGAGHPEMSMMHTPVSWSLLEYRSSVPSGTEAWDELEKSIVANLADEVRVYIKGGEVELVIYKKF